jgi:hypothetical protein
VESDRGKIIFMTKFWKKTFRLLFCDATRDPKEKERLRGYSGKETHTGQGNLISFIIKILGGTDAQTKGQTDS